MTVIVAIVSPGANVVMAADSRASAGCGYTDGQRKVFRKGDILIGMAGLSLYSRWLHAAPDYRAGIDPSVEEYLSDLSDSARAWGRDRGHGESRDGAHAAGPALLAATVNGVWEIDPDGCIITFPRRWGCIGTGGAEANGVLWTLDALGWPLIAPAAAENAVRAASDFDTSCGGRISVETIGYPLPLPEDFTSWTPPDGWKHPALRP